MKRFTSLVLTVVLVSVGACSQEDTSPVPQSAPVTSVPEEVISPVQTESSATSAPVQPAGDDAVGLKPSFQVAQTEGKTVSHSPAVVFTADGKRMVSATSEMEVIVFDTITRKILKRVTFPEKGTDGVSIDASGRYAAWALKEGGIGVMEIETGKVVARDKKISAKWLAVTPDGKRVAISHGKSLQVREMDGFKLVRELQGHTGDITYMVWSQDGKMLASTAKDGVLMVHDEAGKTVLHFKKDAALYAAAFNPVGKTIAYGGHDKKVYERPMKGGEEQVIAGSQPYYITCLGYSPDGETLAVGDESCDVWLFELPSNKMTFHGKHHVECWLNSVAWSTDAKTFLFGCRPHSHAGRPTVYSLNTITEAAQSDEVRLSRQHLVLAIDRQLADGCDDTQKKTLEAYRTRLKNEERLSSGGAVTNGSLSGWSAGAVNNWNGELYISFKEQKINTLSILGADGQENITDSTGEQKAVVPQAVKLPEEIRKLAEKHEKALQGEMKKLNGNFNWNQFQRLK